MLAISTGVGCAKSVLVCQGDRLELTCSGTGNSQQWTVYPDDGTAQNFVVGILSPTRVDPPELTVNQVLFHFSINSTSPLTSTVVIDNVTADANGIRLVCTHSAGMRTSQTINVVTNGNNMLINCFVVCVYMMAIFVHLDAHSNSFNSFCHDK